MKLRTLMTGILLFSTVSLMAQTHGPRLIEVKHHAHKATKHKAAHHPKKHHAHPV